MGMVEIFSYSVGCVFVFVIVSTSFTEASQLQGFPILIVVLSVPATGVIFRKRSLVLMH